MLTHFTDEYIPCSTKYKYLFLPCIPADTIQNGLQEFNLPIPIAWGIQLRLMCESHVLTANTDVNQYRICQIYIGLRFKLLRLNKFYK